MGIAAGLLATGVLALVGGTYAHDVVHDQLAPQKIFFPADAKSGLPDNLSQYAGQQVDTGAEAKAYANDFIGLHLTEIAGGKTYAEVSGASLADPTNQKLAQQTQTLFRGETLRGLLLNAWGWATVGTVAIIAGIVLLVLGGLLFLLPALDWLLNDRRVAGANAAPARPAPIAGD
ncbi:hypothetical protein [Capillimicrobium parvum]|uniref:Aromatic ring-opening dioxygenase LigA n=1 Tax=Capillimicrobium parvum TaxID=2884022 RepID=A0A9E6XSX4_9ACTN|nr:hypothetical protein [Capillimicrobium parvum]UGS34055.1 hypothetical protein DSM104329_00426 [Capillimicrobium parvum]